MSIKNTQRRSERFRLPLGDDGNVVVPLDKEGKYDYGAVQRHYRIFEKEWTTEELSIRYAEALKPLGIDGREEDEDIKVTARWIRLMEQQNRVPRDPKRRWILAIILGIPAASFGLVPTDDSLTKLRAMEFISKKPDQSLPPVDYWAFLQSCWRLNHTITAQDLQGDIKRRIKRLHYGVIYGSPEEHDQMMRLLCYYHQLDARIACDQQRFTDAVDAMNKAYKVARNLQSPELQALVFYRRGYVYFENGYTKTALNDFNAAMQLTPHISRPLRGAIQLAAGFGYAFVAQNQRDKSDFLMLIDEAHNNIGMGDVDEHEHFMGFDEASYTFDRAAALTGSPIIKLHKEHEASDLISKLDSASASPRRQTAISRIEAKIYLDQGYHAMAATRAMDALSSMSYTWNIVDITAIYQQLKEGKYGDIKEVTDLGLALLKVRRPQLFNKRNGE